MDGAREQHHNQVRCVLCRLPRKGSDACPLPTATGDALVQLDDSCRRSGTQLFSKTTVALMRQLAIWEFPSQRAGATAIAVYASTAAAIGCIVAGEGYH